MNGKKALVRKVLSRADVEINGSRPWDLIVHDERFYNRLFRDGTLGFGESYMDGWWDSQQLDVLFTKILKAELDQSPEIKNWKTAWHLLKPILFNFGHKLKAFNIGKKHYDIGNDLFRLMLGEVMAYSCGYWRQAKNLAEAQLAKFELIARKLQVQPGQKILDIGCGWGELAKYLAEKHQVEVVGTTVSQEQAKLAREKCAGLPVTILLKDYRDLQGKFDRVISVGMFEHVGYKNYRQYMQTVAELLKDDGLTLLHTIAGNKSVRSVEAWIDKYIFPGGMLPSIAQIGRAIENIFVMEDWHNFGTDYDKTLMAWFKNFDEHYPKLKEKYGHRFYRMWKYYLLSCAGSFRARKNQLWQIVLSKKGVPGGYRSVR